MHGAGRVRHVDAVGGAERLPLDRPDTRAIAHSDAATFASAQRTPHLGAEPCADRAWSRSTAIVDTRAEPPADGSPDGRAEHVTQPRSLAAAFGFSDRAAERSADRLAVGRADDGIAV